MVLFLGMVVVLLSVIRLYTYASWAWRNGLYRGAVGIIIVAVVTVGLPVYLLLFREF